MIEVGVGFNFSPKNLQSALTKLSMAAQIGPYIKIYTNYYPDKLMKEVIFESSVEVDNPLFVSGKMTVYQRVIIKVSPGLFNNPFEQSKHYVNVPVTEKDENTGTVYNGSLEGALLCIGAVLAIVAVASSIGGGAGVGFAAFAIFAT